MAGLRNALRKATRQAVTVGYGPRFLHSTGQLHKGDGGRGLFIQLCANASIDIGIPDATGAAKSTMSFDVLKQAQMLGDAEALRAAGRKVLRFELGTDAVASIKRLAGILA